jgi:hypothetical protein
MGRKNLNASKSLKAVIRKLHGSVVFIIVVCLVILAGLGYLAMTTDQEIPQAVTVVITSVISGLLGYEVGRRE